jgi:hypothetical protein
MILTGPPGRTKLVLGIIVPVQAIASVSPTVAGVVCCDLPIL